MLHPDDIPALKATFPSDGVDWFDADDLAHLFTGCDFSTEVTTDAAYIAACHPERIRRLVEEVERLRAAINSQTDGLAELIRESEREVIATHFDSLDKGVGGFYDPHEPAEIIRALGPKLPQG